MVQDLLVRLGWSGFSLVFVVGLFTMTKGREQQAQSGCVAATETTRIRDLRPGTVEVKGTARPAESATVLESPITKTDALAIHVAVEEWESDGQGAGGWGPSARR